MMATEKLLELCGSPKYSKLYYNKKKVVVPEPSFFRIGIKPWYSPVPKYLSKF
jgi:hypothetical protein